MVVWYIKQSNTVSDQRLPINVLCGFPFSHEQQLIGTTVVIDSDHFYLLHGWWSMVHQNGGTFTVFNISPKDEVL